MKRKTLFYYLSSFALAVFLLGACTTEVDWDNLGDNLKIDQSLVLPIGEASLTLEDILNQLDTIDFINSEGSDIYVEYSDSISWDIREYKMSLNTVPVQKTLNPSPGGITPLPANTTISLPFDEIIELGINSNPLDQRVDSAKINSAKFKITCNKENLDINPENIKITLTIPNQKLIFDDPSITSIVYTPTAFNTVQEITLPPFTFISDNSTTSMPIHVELEITTDANPIIATPASAISVLIDVADFDMKVAYGFFKPTASDDYKIESVDLGNFQDGLPEGLLRLAEPRIDVTVTNNVGIRLGVNLDYIKAYRKDEADYDTVYAQFKNNQHSTKLIINPASNYGAIATTEYTIDKDSGQIHRLFDNKLLANKLDYKYKLTNERTSGVDFIIPKPKIDVHFMVKVPLKFDAGSYVEIKDTIADLDLESTLDQDYIENAILVLKITNGLPVGVDFKLKLLDLNGQKITSTIDSLFTIDAAQLDAMGSVDRTKLTPQELRIEVNKSQIPQLKSAKSIAFTVRVERKDNKLFKFEKSNSFAVRAGIFVKGDMPVNFNNEDDN